MHAIESIGPVLGIVAFIGLAVLAFLLFQQAREIRRVRDWAGRAPERAAEAAEAVQATAEAARDEEGAEVPEGEPAAEPAPGRIRGALQRFWWGVRDRFAAVDRLESLVAAGDEAGLADRVVEVVEERVAESTVGPS